MVTSIVGKWGNSLAIRVPGSIAAAARISDGDPVTIEAAENAITIRAAVPVFTASALFKGRSAAEWRSEYANAYNFGPDAGSEIVEE